VMGLASMTTMYVLLFDTILLFNMFSLLITKTDCVFVSSPLTLARMVCEFYLGSQLTLAHIFLCG